MEPAPTTEAMGTAPVYNTFCESLRSERAWRNVQPVLLASFTSVAQLLTAQAQQIQELHQQLTLIQDLPSAGAVQTGNRGRQRTAEARNGGIGAEPSERALCGERSLGRDSGVPGVQSSEEIHQQVADSKRELECEWRVSLQESIATQCEVQSQLLRKEVEQELGRVKPVLVGEIMDKVQQQLREGLTKSANRADSSTAKIGHGPEHDMNESVHEDRDRDRVAQEIQSMKAKLFKQLAAWRQQLEESINKKPSRSEVTKLLSRKISSLEARKELAEKADSVRIEEISSELVDMVQRAQETMMRQFGNSRADVHEIAQLKQNLHELLSVVESLQLESSGLRAALAQKVSVEDAKQLIDSRTTLAGLEKAIAKMESAIAQDFSTKADLQSVAQQVHCIKQQLRSEMYQARYIWKDGRPSLKQTISWNTQVMNTNADVFVWKSGSDKIMLKIPGLYHLQAAFFTDFAPTIQVLINGEPGLVLAGEENVAVAGPAESPGSNSSRGGKSNPRGGPATALNGFRRVHHSAGNLVGLAIDAFLALPARAVVQISYDIDEKAQGFLNLRKL